MNILPHYIDAFTHLHTAKVKGYRAPHKAVLLLAVIDLVEDGKIVSSRIELSDALVDRFNALWYRYLGTSAVFSPDVTKPFFHMQHESFWWLVEHEEASQRMVADDYPCIGEGKETKELPHGSYSVNAMRKAFAYAEIDYSLFQLLRNADARAMLRVILINEYLTNQPTKSVPDLSSLLLALPLLAFVA